MGRYTLKVNVPGYGNFDVAVPEQGMEKMKVSLTSIDSFTIGKSADAILKQLDFKDANVKGRESFYVSYISQGEEKRLNTIFQDAHGLKKIASKNERKINVENSVFCEFIEKTFLPMITSQKFHQFLKSNSLISYKLDEWILNYLHDDYNLDFCYSKIKEYASDYKQFRGLVLGVELYKNNIISNPIKEEKTDKTEEPDRPYYKRYVLSKNNDEDDIDPDRLFGLWSEEELRKYDEYLDNLPYEFHPHDKNR